MRRRTGLMRTTRTLAAAVLLLALAACGDDGDDVDAGRDGDDGGSGSTTGTAPDGAEPGGGDGELFIEIAYVGGFMIEDFQFRSVPQAVVYADGTVFAPGAIPAIHPGPAVSPVFTGTLDDDTLAELLDAAAVAGMIGGSPDVGDAGALPIADAASTRVTVVVDGDEQVVEAYALAEAGGPGFGQTGLTDAQVEARATLAELVAVVTEAALAAQDPYLPERYRVLASTPPDDAGLDVQPNQLEWPAGLPEPVEGTCVAVTGDAAAALTEELASATEITRWTVGDRVLTLAVRPVLPHEPDCEA
jgi:hypothetical protein